VRVGPALGYAAVASVSEYWTRHLRGRTRLDHWTDGVLYGLSPSSGAIHQSANVGNVINHFPTPSVGDGLLLVPTANHVVAFAATS